MHHEEVASVLHRLTPGEIPLDIFNEVARLTVLPVIELIVEFQGKVLLNKRPEDDIYWPNQYCLPGRIISSKDNVGLSEQVKVLYDNLKIINNAKPEIVFSTVRLFRTSRGVELALIYKAALDDYDYTADEKHSFILKSKIYKMNDIISEHKEIIKAI